MKKILFAVILLVGCSKKDKISDSLSHASSRTSDIAASTTTFHHIGDPNRTPNLYILENDPGWLGYSSLGLWTIDARPRIEFDNTGQARIGYNCWIGNGVKNSPTFQFDPSGQKDFVVCRPCDGIIDSSYTGSYDNLTFPGMLAIRLFQNGEYVGNKIKQQFWVEPNFERDNFPWNGYPRYGNDTMYIYWGTADNYFNRINVPTVNGTPVQGKYVVQVEVNPDGVITESNKDDNIGLMPVSIVGTTVTIDQSAIAENVPKPITDLKAVYNGKGQYKTVTLTWTSKAQEFCVAKDGVMIKSVYGTSANGVQQYVDTVSGGFKSASYFIQAENEGIGKIVSPTLTVKK
jgi:hypothetical protein